MPAFRLHALPILVTGLMFALLNSAIAEEGFVPASKSDKKIIFQKFSSSPVYSPPTDIWWLAPSTSHDDKVPLSLIQIEGSEWTREDIVAEVRAAEEIFSQCQLSFDPILLVEAGVRYTQEEMASKLAAGVENVDMLDLATWDLQFVEGLALPKPLILFRDDLYSYAYAERDVAPASRNFMPLLGMAYVTSDSRDGWSDKSSTAHELAHLLANEGHNADADNLLCGDDAWDTTPSCGSETQLTAAQCERIGWWVQRRAPQFQDLIHTPR